jgi:hypothetical protein
MNLTAIKGQGGRVKTGCAAFFCMEGITENGRNNEKDIDR